MIIRPQAGPQEDFLSTAADVALYGGAAGGGKTWALLMEPLRWVHIPEFRCIIFRRTMPRIRNEGGLWDESQRLYGTLGAEGREGPTDWTFPSGAKIKFTHLQHEKDRLSHKGAQLDLVCFDELTEFTEGQFWYLFSRARSRIGIKTYFRMGTNPDAGSWVRQFIAWWIDKAGYPIRERCGVRRWFVRIDNQVQWVDQDYVGPEGERPQSFTFIAAKVTDNAALLKLNPEYVSKLQALDKVERERLLGGNWNVVADQGGDLFPRDMIRIVTPDQVPHDIAKRVRFWDLAASKPTMVYPNPDWSAGIRQEHDDRGCVWFTHARRFRENEDEVLRRVSQTAKEDGRQVAVRLNEDPGQAGKGQIGQYIRLLAGCDVAGIKESGSKRTRALPLSAQWRAGNCRVVDDGTGWLTAFLDEMESFPIVGCKDDQVDAASAGYSFLVEQPKRRQGSAFGPRLF